MGVCVGRLREDAIFDYKFVGLSHNTLRGAAGGAVLIAEPALPSGLFKLNIFPLSFYLAGVFFVLGSVFSAQAKQEKMITPEKPPHFQPM